MATAVINVDLNSILFFMLGFFTCAAVIVVIAILYVVLPKVKEARNFFKFYLGLKDKEKAKFKEEAKQ